MNLAPRLNTEQANILVGAATNHTHWNVPDRNSARVVPVRKDMIAAVGGCVGRLRSDELASLSAKAIPLATNRKHDNDYDEAVNLLCAIAYYGGEHIRSSLRDTLYPPGERLNAVLVQVAAAFGKEIGDEESWAESAEGVARNLRLQVQRCPHESEFQPVSGSFGALNVALGTEKLRVHIASTVELVALMRHRQRVPRDSLRGVIDAVLDMVAEKENLLTNKAALIHAVRDVGDSCCTDDALRIFKVLSSLARGQVPQPPHVMSAAEADNPLNPFKICAGKPSEVRGAALYALAFIEREQPGVFGKTLDELLELALADSDPEVRVWAFAAAREKPVLSDAAFVALLLGTRDVDPKAAQSAFRAIANKSGVQLSEPLWLLLVHSARTASESRFVGLRRAAAYASRKLLSLSPDGRVQEELKRLIDAFPRDTCYSVRKAAVGPEPEE